MGLGRGQVESYRKVWRMCIATDERSRSNSGWSAAYVLDLQQVPRSFARLLRSSNSFLPAIYCTTYMPNATALHRCPAQVVHTVQSLRWRQCSLAQETDLEFETTVTCRRIVKGKPRRSRSVEDA